MKAENQGFIARAKEAIAGTIQTIEEVLGNAIAAVGKILKDPVTFLSDLIDGVRQGFNNFVANIGQHLQNGLVAWLTSAMGNLGIQISQNLFSIAKIEN